MRLAIADERLRVRNMPHLASLRGRAGALVTPTGRIIASEPYGGWPARVADPDRAADRVLLDDGREMEVEPLAEGYLLHATTAARRRPAAPARCRCGSLGDDRAAGHAGRRARAAHAAARPSCSPRSPCTPTGCTAEQLALLLYGDDGNPTTVRGEVLRLRGLIGADVLRTRPYRLDAVVDTDFGAARRALRAGQVAEALRACAGPLLPRSDAPEIRELRDELAAGLRRAVLDSDDVELLADVRRAPPGRATTWRPTTGWWELPPHDPRRPGFAARLARLLAE